MTDQAQRRENLKRLLRPRHIAFIGGSQVSGAIATSQRAGFAGQLWVVNPVRDEIGGLPCYGSVEELPEAPDAVLIAMSPERSIVAVEALAAIGAGGAVCMVAGFAELGDRGLELQRKLQQAAGNLAVIGPNCMGVLNLFDGAAVWGTGNHLGYPGSRGAAIVSQSGAFIYGITNVEQCFPLGYAISTGNQAVVDMADCIETLLCDDRVRAIGLYLEGLEDGNALGAACWHALEKGIPIVALKGGDTAAAEAVAISHTSAMVVERDLWKAFCQRYGIAEVSSPKVLVETLKLVTIGGVPRGNRLTAVTYSGALNSLIVAQAPGLGISLIQPTAANAAKLRAQLPEIITVANPLDLNLPWTSKTGMSWQDREQIGACLCALADEVADIAAMFLDVPRADGSGAERSWYAGMEAMASIRDSLNIPCVVAGILPEGLEPGLRKHLLALGIVPLLGFSDSMEALSVAVRIGQIFGGKTGKSAPADLVRPGPKVGAEIQAAMMDEAESKLALRQYGLVTPEFRVVAAAEAPKAATKVGYPVALKLVSDRVSHKAEIGGVKLGLASEQAVEKAVAEIITSAGKAAGFDIDCFLVEPMIADARLEYIIGIKRQSALGLALMVGRGGTNVESINFHATVLLPLVEDDLRVAMACIGLGESDAGYESMREAIHSIADYARDHATEIESLDVNPVILTESNDAIACDALILLSGPEKKRAG